MLELLNQLDGFSSTDDVKVFATTNRADGLARVSFLEANGNRKTTLAKLFVSCWQ